MKEMCRNFICNSNRCPQEKNSTPHAAQDANAFAILPDTTMGSCSSCVMNRIGLAQAYVPSQPYTTPMGQEQSLVCGTVFSELAMPYCSGWNLQRFKKEV